MNVPTYSETLIATDQLQEPDGNPSIDTLLSKTCLHALTKIWNAVIAYDPVEDAFETFNDSGGI